MNVCVPGAPNLIPGAPNLTVQFNRTYLFLAAVIKYEYGGGHGSGSSIFSGSLFGGGLVSTLIQYNWCPNL